MAAFQHSTPVDEILPFRNVISGQGFKRVCRTSLGVAFERPGEPDLRILVVGRGEDAHWWILDMSAGSRRGMGKGYTSDGLHRALKAIL